ncbi:hypothetical protein HG536_0A07220 [Torulaspora globosa]|uniref:Ribonuclease T2-like n=1 Tax=Torulaspora globosa TaxID=48254 RepID=A0A7G3ZBM1_9SACH|nr:uncharacterized protein HG536_0A07220 [Torulaspora globosa]QLL30907.1 hypothetical protein HG536_0A07220 [Torulaspora globosa]
MYIKNLVPFLQSSAKVWKLNGGDEAYPPQCPIDLPLSCQNHTAIEDTCCFEYPGGIFLQSQLWDYIPSRSGMDDEELEKQLGPLDSFTIHGLWPDNCGGGFEQFCDDSLAIDDVYYLLNSEQFNDDKRKLEIPGRELLKEMSRLWKSNNGDDESLWIHEYNKHGTCIKTIRPKCYSRWGNREMVVSDVDYKKQSVYDYFRVAYNTYKRLNTTEILKEHGIVPSLTKTYTRHEIQSALNSGFNNQNVHFACDNHHSLKEVWYYHLLQGSLLSEDLVPVGYLGNGNSKCPEKGIKFYPKGYMPSKKGGEGPKGPLYRGIIRVSGYEGFLIRNGHWMIKGTPANFKLVEAPFGGFYLVSRNGYCGLTETGLLTCNKHIGNAGQFEYDADKGYLGYSGSFEWGATVLPHGNVQSFVYLGDAAAKPYQFKLKFIRH